jgi:hypothetical protein
MFPEPNPAEKEDPLLETIVKTDPVVIELEPKKSWCSIS